MKTRQMDGAVQVLCGGVWPVRRDVLRSIQRGYLDWRIGHECCRCGAVYEPWIQWRQ